MKKKKNRILLFLVMVFMVANITGYAETGENSESVTYYSYSISKDLVQLEKETYVPEENTLDFILQNLIARFGSKNQEERVYGLLPQEVCINSYELKGTVLWIDFNSQYSKMSRTREILVRAGIVKTFVQFPEIHAVCFTVIGDEITDSKRQIIGEMTEDTFVEYSGTQEQNNYRQEILTLYFTNADGSGLVKENRKVYYRPSLQKERVVLEQLIKGPMEKGNYPTLSDNISVLNISITDNICYVSLTQSFIDSALALNAQIPIYSIVNSLVDSCGAERVELSVEGNSEAVFGENMSLYQFYEKNEELLQLSEENKLLQE